MSQAQFTCINCQVVFKSGDIQRDHYKTDWHRYNLKRKLAELPPVTCEEFQRRVRVIQLENEETGKAKTHTYCTVCQKSFASVQSFQNHLASKKHLDLSKTREPSSDVAVPSLKNQKSATESTKPTIVNENQSMETDSSGTEEELSSDEWEEIISENNPIANNDCLFCSHHSASLTKNAKHMSTSHSFFIPHIEYLVDLQGLLLYLGEKICQGYMCIWCNDRKTCFSSIDAVRNHMIDKGHAKIAMDTESSLEYLDFYDFHIDYDENQCDDEALIVNQKKPLCKTEDSLNVAMLLPSGDSISHRSLLKYFRQNPVVAVKKTKHVKETKVQKLINYYRGLGWNPTQKELIKKHVQDLKYLHRIQAKFDTKLRVKANKLQKHFRPQVDF